MESIIKKPKDCSSAELNTFERLVREGGEVEASGLRKRIGQAEQLIFIYDGECIAVGAIKNPSTKYKYRVFKKSGVNNPDQFELELGWLYVTENARRKGIGRILMQNIVRALTDKGCFATTREENTSMHSLFGEFDFLKLGYPYKSEKGDYSLVLYARL